MKRPIEETARWRDMTLVWVSRNARLASPGTTICFRPSAESTSRTERGDGAVDEVGLDPDAPAVQAEKWLPQLVHDARANGHCWIEISRALGTRPDDLVDVLFAVDIDQRGSTSFDEDAESAGRVWRQSVMQVQVMRGYGKRYKIIVRRGSYHRTRSAPRA
jgi:hypothetical protein